MATARAATRSGLIRRLWACATTTLGLGAYVRAPGDGRVAPVVPVATVLRALLLGYLLRDGSFHGIEALVRSAARRALGVPRAFGDDTVAYVTERLDVAALRGALGTVLSQAKRRHALEAEAQIGWVLDGTTVGACPRIQCPWCHPVIRPARPDAPHPSGVGTVVGQIHKLSLLTVVGGALVLPVDVEPYGPADSEAAASLRLLTRGVTTLGRRFGQYVVADGLYATAPFLHAAGDLGLHAVVRLKGNVPTLYAEAQARFAGQPPTTTFTDAVGARVEAWDADDFPPWDPLRWDSVRVLRYRQTHATGAVAEAYWLTDFSSRRLSTRRVYEIAKHRWAIENQGFNDGKTRYGLAHVPHHHPTSLLLHWLLVALTLTIERLYRLRYLHRGPHPRLTAMQLLRRLRLSLGQPVLDTS